MQCKSSSNFTYSLQHTASTKAITTDKENHGMMVAVLTVAVRMLPISIISVQIGRYNTETKLA